MRPPARAVRLLTASALALAGALPLAAEAPEVPVREVEISFENAGATLAGSLFLPPGEGPHPAFVMLQGRGYGRRDLLRRHAVVFAEHGVAGLVFDGRGRGQSTGTVGTVTLEERIGDALAALETVAARPEIDPERVGLVGHSAGGWIAPVVARKSGTGAVPAVRWLILRSAPAEPRARQLGTATHLAIEDSGFPLDEVELEVAALHQRRLVELAIAGATWDEIAEHDRHATGQRWAPFVHRPGGPSDPLLAEWRREPFDSTDALRATTIPVLALYGGLDRTVPPGVHAVRLGALLSQAGNADFEVVTFPEADHSLKTADPEGGRRDVDGYWETVLDWLLPRVREPGA